ncbi:MAG: sulfide/dihydroorotate dehydrogenase-like FAD/NAD-binding protein [candidate division NC10 bacterium]|nr:sulfide/dihydroorotate dehydrogenase-like FAD/NAD-binding protein [candidate division NC10 bacterium]
MFRILTTQNLASSVQLMEVEAPFIAQKVRAGQFVVVRRAETSERIPLTVADWDGKRGSLTLIFQEVGKSTVELGKLRPGDSIQDLIGPLGRPSEIARCGTVVCVGGGIGIAPIYPIARAHQRKGNRVLSILGARRKDLLILEEEMRALSEQLWVTTDDGSYGRHGLVTDELRRLAEEGEKIDLVVAIGPPIMMQAVCRLTETYGIKTIVSLDSIMVDGTGMCGACRVTVGGKTRFVCVHGPEFDGHQVDFDEYIRRKKMYLAQEKEAMERCQPCREGGCLA